MRAFPIITLARFVFAAGLMGLGILSLTSGDFALNWQPVANWLPWREVVARLSGIVLLAGGAGMLVKRAAAVSALILAFYWLLCAILMHLSRVVQHPSDIGLWLGFAENLLVACGGWLFFDSLSTGTGDEGAKFSSGLQMVRTIVGCSCVVFGLSHFRYTAETAAMVPAWLPDRTAFALLTGAGHLAAGLAILFRVLPRLAATLEAAMISSFVLIIHLPSVVALPSNRLQWTMLFIASTLAASAWAVAGSFCADRWLARPHRKRKQTHDVTIMFEKAQTNRN